MLLKLDVCVFSMLAFLLTVSWKSLAPEFEFPGFPVDLPRTFLMGHRAACEMGIRAD